MFWSAGGKMMKVVYFG